MTDHLPARTGPTPALRPLTNPPAIQSDVAPFLTLFWPARRQGDLIAPCEPGHQTGWICMMSIEPERVHMHTVYPTTAPGSPCFARLAGTEPLTQRLSMDLGNWVEAYGETIAEATNLAAAHAARRRGDG